MAVDNVGNARIAGNIFGSLLDDSQTGDADAFLIKYDTAGNRVWSRQIGTTSGEQGCCVAVDPAANSYIAGLTAGSLGGPSFGSSDVFLAKYDDQGNQLWSRQIGSPRSPEFDAPQGVATDSAGNAFVSGITYGALGSAPHIGGLPGNPFPDGFLLKYDPTGELLWVRRVATTGYEDGVRVAVDQAGNAYASGTTTGSMPGANNGARGARDVFLAKYDSGGNRQWVRQLGTDTDDFAGGVATDGLNNVFVYGYTLGSLGGSNGGPDGHPDSQDVFLAKYDSAGSLLWMRQFGTMDREKSAGFSVDSAGNAYLGWTLSPPGGGPYTAYLTKYNPAGAILWTEHLSQRGGVAVDGAGAVYVGGESDFAKYSTVPEPSAFALTAIVLTSILCRRPTCRPRQPASA